MSIKQLSVFAGNNKGSLADVTSALADAGIDLMAMTVADTQDYGILRIIVKDTQLAADVLHKNGYISSATDVVAVSIPNQTGGLAKVLRLLSEKDISVEYSYSFCYSADSNAYIVLRVTDNAETEKCLSENGIVVANADTINNL